ncbi:MAG: hypothetical protein FJ050_08665 [Cyanobacteria bacterium M_surface_7_m2_040]|nr:hypothetical protein [Cyanobacteria bacterium M_surface_7_m2_040]
MGLLTGLDQDGQHGGDRSAIAQGLQFNHTLENGDLALACGIHLHHVVGAAHTQSGRTGATVLGTRHQNLTLLQQKTTAPQFHAGKAVDAGHGTAAETQLAPALQRLDGLRHLRLLFDNGLLALDVELLAIKDLLHRDRPGIAGGTRG